MVHPIAEASATSPFGSLSVAKFYAHHSVSHTSAYVINSAGLKLFSQSWLPLPPANIIGTISVLHGFKDNSSWILQLTCVHFAKLGFATCAIDYQGHGNSEGLRDYIPNINTVVHDCSSFFTSFRSKYPISVPSFLYGESLGGAIALLIHVNSSTKERPWDGIILHGAMCNISKCFKPLWPLEHLSFLAAKLIPTWKVIPTVSLPHVSYKEDWKRNLALACPNRGLGFPRAATGHEFVRLCSELQTRFGEVVAPILILQGGGDSVCDPKVATELYEQAQSKDKTLRVYEGMWHVLTGESGNDVELVFGEIGRWLLQRAQGVNDA
ncbi:acylglycerol lipase [Ranunculus cassubicifolius]